MMEAHTAGTGATDVGGEPEPGGQEEKEETIRRYVKLHACSFCRGRHYHTCSLFDCREPARKAREYAGKHYSNGRIDG